MRTAVSRSYYASFLTARNYADKILGKTIFYSSEDHYLVKKYLAGAPDIEISELADDLGELQECRKAADYDMDAHIPENHVKVEDIYLMAENVVNTILAKTSQCTP